MEAAPGIEPGNMALQATALPFGYAASCKPNSIQHMRGKSTCGLRCGLRSSRERAILVCKVMCHSEVEEWRQDACAVLLMTSARDDLGQEAQGIPMHRRTGALLRSQRPQARRGQEIMPH